MKIARSLLCGVVCLAFTFGLSASTFAADKGDEKAGEDVVPLVIGLLGDKDKDVRALGLEQVRTTAKGPAATRQFAAQLPKLSPEAQAGLLSALSDRGDAAARPAVVALLAESRAEPVRVAAIGAVGSLGEVADSRLLVLLLSEGSKAEKTAARAGLVRLRGEAVPQAIAAEMKQANAPIRVILIGILATRRALDTIPEILPAAVDADPAVRAAAMVALGQMAGPEQIPGMVQGVLKAKSGPERTAAERAVALVCGRIAEPQKRAEPLLAAMDGLTGEQRIAMLPTLGRVGGDKALKIVEAALASLKEPIHDIGIRALCNWPDASVAPRLIVMATLDEHPEHRLLALRALIRVAPLRDKRPDSEKLALLQKAMAMSGHDAERNMVIARAQAIRTLDSLRFLVPYLDQPAYAQAACQSIVELAHHRELREPNKAEFDRALDKVIQTSHDATIVDRANRYKKGQTWARPVAPERP